VNARHVTPPAHIDHRQVTTYTLVCVCGRKFGAGESNFRTARTGKHQKKPMPRGFMAFFARESYRGFIFPVLNQWRVNSDGAISG